MTSARLALTRPAVSVDELKRAWQAVQAGQFRGARGGLGSMSHPTAQEPVTVWAPAPGEQVVPMLGVTGSAGTSTLALMLALVAERPARVVECSPPLASGLASASTAELGLHETGWCQGKRDQVLIERTSEPILTPDQMPVPTTALHDNQLTVLDVGWEASGVLTAQGWLTAALGQALALVLVMPASLPAVRRLDALIELLAARCPSAGDRVCLAVLGPRRKKWPAGLEHSGGPATQQLLASDRVIEVPRDRDLAATGVDSRPLPAAILRTAANLMHLIDEVSVLGRAVAETVDSRSGGDRAWSH